MTIFKPFLVCLLTVSLLLSTSVQSRPLADEAVPEPLKPWIDWVLWEHQERDCPMLYNTTQHLCIWPGELVIELNDTGGRFNQSLTVYRESQVSLPGSNKYWPVEVTVNGSPAAIVARGSVPTMRLEPGRHRIEGQFSWERLPESLPIPLETGLISLQVNGVQRDHPELREGQLWLLSVPMDNSIRTPEDRLRFEVFRRVIDSHPLRLITLLKLEVSGKQREVILGQPLLQEFIPQEIRSPLPARLELDGHLRIQVRPGDWDLEIHAVQPGYLTKLNLATQPKPWPQEEIWSFEARPSIRLVEIEGARQIDPLQTRLPPAWRSLPAYQVEAGQTLSLKVERRGDPQPEPDKLQLQRDLWLDFNGQGYTLRDSIRGAMTSDWRLSVDPELNLGRVTLNGTPQFITRLESDERLGVEVRQGNINLVGESRIEDPGRDLPASGWGRTFQQMGAVLHLPPGWRLFAVSGVDREHHSWLKQWTLYDLFLVFVIAAAVGKLWGWRWAVPTLVTLALIWHEPDAPRHIWLYLLAVTALQRALPAGKYQNAAKLAGFAGIAVLLVIVLPFMVDQARIGLYPQLGQPDIQPYQPLTQPASRIMSEDMVQESPPAPSEKRMGHLKEKLSSIASMPRSAEPLVQEHWSPDPKANIQTGPGLPSWQWQQIPLSWNGPVAPEQRINLTLAGPSLNLLLNGLRIVMLLFLVWRVVDRVGLNLPKKGPTTAVLLLLTLPMMWDSAPVMAAYPTPELLQQLEQRLTQPPECLPQCADIPRMGLALTETTLSARLQVNALVNTTIPLPVDPVQQTPVQVLLDGNPAGLVRDQEGLLWIELAQGQHEILLSARLPNRTQLQIPLPLTPHRVEVTTEAWRVEGLHENQVPDRLLNLTRKQSLTKLTENHQTAFAVQTLPPFVQVERTLRLDLEWSVETRVRRLSPTGSPIVLHIPLLTTESVISEGIRVKDQRALVSMEPTTREVRWQSRLPIGGQLKLTAPQTDHWVELWRVDVGPHWHAQITGLAPVHHQGQNRWLPTWMPWSDESVTLELSRPQGVEGATRTIEHSSLTLSPGQRATHALLEFHLRSSQGGRHGIKLPEGTELLAVKIDNRPQPIRLQGLSVSLPVHPGEQTYQLEWRQNRGIQAHWNTPNVDLGLPSVNTEIQLQMTQDRWILFARGPQLGPAVLFWGELLVILLVALILGRLRDYSPLGMISWLLLGIGLSQVSIWAALLVATTFFAFGYRRRIDPQQNTGTFNLLQIGLVLLSLFTLVTLFWAVQQGLLGLPEMQISGNGSNVSQLNWYQDRSNELLPVAAVYSAPLLVYRLLMLAWALWLAFSLLGWVKWSWEAFSHRGRWIEIKLKLPKRRKMSKHPAPKGN